MKRICSLLLTLIIVIGIFSSIPINVSAATAPDTIKSFSIDKTLMSEGETATITITVAEGYTAKWFYIYKPITNNTETIYMYLSSDNTYTGTFKVDAQTESGVWKVKYLTLKNTNDEYVYLYNSNNYTGTTRETIDFSSIDFEVIGTNADVTAPVIETYSVNKTVVSAGESVLISATIADAHLPSSFYLYYKTPGDESKSVLMKKVDDTGLYQGTFTIVSETEIGLWRPYRFFVSDANENVCELYNSNTYTGTYYKKADLSSLNFEVVDVGDDSGTNESSESCIVIFKDGYGNTLSTQKVAKGESAIEPDIPTNELYLFNGWDTDFSSVTSNLTVTALWVLDPNAVYDYEIHQGSSFNIEVFSQTSQNYTITCNEDIDFETNLYGTSYTITNGAAYYGKEYKITVNEPGSYIFYVKGSRASNTLSYKVKITSHNYKSETILPTCIAQGYTKYTCSICNSYYLVDYIEKIEHIWTTDYVTDAHASCATEGIKSIHCTYCNTIKEGSQVIIPTTDDHTASDWIIDEIATCTGEGTKHKECTECGEVLETAVIPQLKPSTPKLSKVESVTSGTKISWDEVAGADNYNIYRKTYDTKTKKWSGWEKIKEGIISTSYIDTSAKSATNYSYTVIANNEVGSSEFNETGLEIYYLSTPKITSIVNVTSGVTVKWEKVSGANGYYVYRKTGNGNWTKIATIKSNGTVSYTDKTAKPGVTYKYTVKAYSGSYTSSNKASDDFKRLTTPKITSIVNVTSGVTIKWEKVSGANGYYVYRKTGNGNWTKIATIKSNGTVSYTDKTAKPGVTYKYTVKAYSDLYTSSNKASGDFKRLTTPKVTSVANDTSGVTVKWGKTAGASGYYVYRKTDTGSWQRVATVKGAGTLSYTDKTAKSGITYKYTVKAYYGSFTSSNQTSSDFRRLTTPTLKSVTSAKSGVTFKWNKVTGATGYIVYRKTGNGSWVKLATVTGNSKITYLDKTAKKGVTYKYTVKAYYGTSTSYYNTKGLAIKDKY